MYVQGIIKFPFQRLTQPKKIVLNYVLLLKDILRTTKPREAKNRAEIYKENTAGKAKE